MENLPQPILDSSKDSDQICRLLRQENLNLKGEARKQKKVYKECLEQLNQLKVTLARVNADIEEEMGMAKSVQEALMPKALPEMVNVKSAAIYIPTGKVGGDLYDIIITPRQRIAFLIFDVSGHGVPAALIGAMAKMLFAHYIEKSESPAQVFREVNYHLCRFIRTEQYLTAFLGIYDPIRNLMTYSRAGHVPPLVYHAGTQKISRLDSKGFFIGHSALLGLAEYYEQKIQLHPGDKVFFYTDGLTEGYSNEGQLYGGERLRKAFALHATRELQDVLDAVLEDQIRFRAGSPLRDDFTMLCIEVGSSEQLLAESGFIREDEPNLLVANSFDDIEKVCAIVLKEMDQCGFIDRTIKQFKVCIFEMLTNAMIHGNQNDTSKKAYIFYKVTPDSAAISVLDQGEGYNTAQVPDPLLPENRFKDSGRGLYIVHHYMDEVSFNVKGNRIMGKKFHHGK